jgi:exodeoxyribonuclease V alpha subunit
MSPPHCRWLSSAFWGAAISYSRVQFVGAAGKSQGSEFPAVVIPLATQHYMLLQRNLIYTGITRGKRLLVLIGQKKALGTAVRNDRPQRRYSGFLSSLRSE